MFRSAIVPEAITLLVRVSTPKRKGTTEVSLLAEVFWINCIRACGPVLRSGGLPRKERLEHVGKALWRRR